MVLVDTSVWIQYFKGIESDLPLNKLIDSNRLCINDLILAELIPSIKLKKGNHLKELLYTATKIEININWNHIIQMQTMNYNKGVNRVGIADLIIAQNAMENGIELYAVDKHFQLMSELHGIKIYKG
jgi:predicted nucleic acid-binding protein